MKHHELSSRIEIDYLKTFIQQLEALHGPNDPQELAYVESIFAAAERVVPRMEQIEPNAKEGRTGAIMVIAKPGDHGYIAIKEIGTIKSDRKRSDVEKRSKYSLFALGKVATLLMHPDWIASSQNLKLPEPEQLRYEDGTPIPAGAIRVDDEHIIGVSSFAAPDDESTVIATQVEAGNESTETALWMALSIMNSRFGEIRNSLLSL